MILLGWLDTLRTVWWWSHARHVLDGLTLRLIDAEWQHPEFENAKWGTAKHLLNKAKQLAEPTGYKLHAASVRVVPAQSGLPWTEASPNEATIYIALHCEYPKAVLYEPPEHTPLIPGQVWAVGGNTRLNSFVNYSDVPAICLTLTLRREQEE